MRRRQLVVKQLIIEFVEFQQFVFIHFEFIFKLIVQFIEHKFFEQLEFVVEQQFLIEFRRTRQAAGNDEFGYRRNG